MSVIGRRWTISNVMDGAYDVSGPPIPRGESVEVVEVVDVQATTTQGAVDENEMLRLQVSALENDGMELAAKLGEAEQQIARLTTRRGQ
jgi:2-methylaconitate cis-trans-isomerase PrpF